MKRREFVALVGGALAWPLSGHAQEAAKPVVGFLSTRAPKDAFFIAPFREGLKEADLTEGENVLIEYRWAENDNSRLPALAANLVERKVDIIIAGGTLPQARAATSTIPIVFTTGLDPLSADLVPSLNQPGGNITGVSFYSGAVGVKRLELLREVVPSAGLVGLLVNPRGAAAESQVQDVQAFARRAGVSVHGVNASSDDDLAPAFAALAQANARALLVSVDPFLMPGPSRW